MSNKLEALKLAVQTYLRFPNVSEDKILECAAKYGKFITGEPEGNSSKESSIGKPKAAPFKK